MLRTAVFFTTLLSAGSVMGAEDDSLSPDQKACSEGYAWHVPAKKPNETVNEQYIILGSGGKFYRICHCSSDAPAGFHVELKAVLPGATPHIGDGFRIVPTKFHRETCLYTDSTLVWIHNSDPKTGASGSIQSLK